MNIKESYIESELYRVFKNLIEKTPKYSDVTFTDIKDRMKVSTGEADMVIFGERDHDPFTLVIEAKKKINRYDQKLDPYSVTVIGQALGYAAALNSRFIATTNGDIFVIFDVEKKGTILQKQVGRSYKVEMNENFATNVLNNISLYLEGNLESIELGDAFIERLRYFHSLISPIVYTSFEKELSCNETFSDLFSKWLLEQGLVVSTEVKHNVAEQAAYLIMNRIVFYKTLESYQSNLKLLPLSAMAEEKFDPKIVLERINECFEYVVTNIDYEAVFSRSQFFDLIPYSEILLSYLNDFIRDIKQYNLSEINRDVIGTVYQRLIPIDERKRLGQYYTPSQVTDLITQFCIQHENTRVLDPSCGSGGFLVSAYERLKILNMPYLSGEALHNKILSQVYGVDVNQFAAHLSVINLTMRDIRSYTSKVNVLSTDFFQIPSLQARIGREHEEVSISNAKSKVYLLVGQFDSVVANPPYTRQDEIGDENYIELIRDNSLTFYDKRYTKKKGEYFIPRKYEMSSEAGIYTYFLMHSTHFLKENGIMGFIIYNSWLDVKFGKYLQKFLLDSFSILAIVDFDRRIFTDAAVNTVVIILKKTDGDRNSEKRDHNISRFVTVKQKIKTGNLVSLINKTVSSLEDETIRIVCVPQFELKKENKWGHYLKAPPLYYRILEKLRTRLKEIADINVGYVTLSNEFFILRKEQAEGLGIEQDFLRPLILNTREIKHLDVSSADCRKYLFLVNKVENRIAGTSAEKYIKIAETKDVEITRGHEKGKIVTGYQNLPALKEKKIWFELPIRQPSRIIVPVLIWDRWFAVLNRDGIYTTQNFYWINPKDEDQLYPLLAVLNSTITEFFVEILGKSGYGGGVIELMKHNFEEIPVIDLKQLDMKTRKKLSELYLELAKYSRSGEDMKTIKKELDVEILKIIGMEPVELDSIYTELNNMRESRKNKVKTSIMLK